MIQHLDPKYIMGRPVQYDNSYYRFITNTKNSHIDKILHYNCGLFYVLDITTPFTISYRCHFKDEGLRISKKQRVEITVLGYNSNTKSWDYLNELRGFENQNCESDIDVIKCNLFQNFQYQKYQLCFPGNGVVYDIKIDSPNTIRYEYVNNNTIFLGSSIAQFCNDCSHMNMCCYLYRKYGINSSTLGVSEYHSFHNDELMRFIKQHTEKRIVVVDLEHVDYKEYQKVRDILLQPNVSFAVIDSKVTTTCRDLSRKFKEIKTILPHADMMCDCRHLNDYGMIWYSDILHSKNII